MYSVGDTNGTNEPNELIWWLSRKSFVFRQKDANDNPCTIESPAPFIKKTPPYLLVTKYARLRFILQTFFFFFFFFFWKRSVPFLC